MAAKDLNVTSQLAMELLFSKHQLLSRIQQEFESSGMVRQLEANNIPVNFGLGLLTQMVLHKRTTVAILVGILKHHFKGEQNEPQACADAILHAAKMDLVDWDPTTEMIVIKYDISQDVQQDLDQFQYPLPMIEAPRTITNNRSTGYQSIKGSIILKNNHTDEDVCLDHINRVNAIPLAINPTTVAFVQNQWKNHNKLKDDETYEKFQKRKRAFAKYDATSRDVLAALLTHSKNFWLTHKYDKRGRTYCQGYHVTYQGNDWNKACVEFADKEVLNAV